MPAAPPRPATTGRCKVLPRINAWRALPRTKSTELGPSGTSVDLFATKHDELNDFMGFFLAKHPVPLPRATGFPVGQSASSEHTASGTAALCGRQREPRSLRGHPRPRVTPTARAAAPASPSVSQTLRSSDAPQNSLHLHCQDRGSKDALVLSAEICASTLGTSGLKGFYLLSLVTNMYDLSLILSETTADPQPCTAMQQCTGGQEARQTFLESKPPVAPWVSKEG